jgi:hypothetical protein
MIRKVYEVDPMVCPKCGGRMKVVAFLADYAVVDRIIWHLKLTLVAETPPPLIRTSTKWSGSPTNWGSVAWWPRSLPSAS